MMIYEGNSNSLHSDPFNSLAKRYNRDPCLRAI